MSSTSITTNASTAKPTTTINILKIYIQTLRIQNTNPFHFINLSLLFLPFIISTVATTLFVTTTPATTLLILTFFTILLTVIAKELITITHAFITFKCTLNSPPHSFLPLLSTFVAAALRLTVIYLFFTHLIKTMSFHPTITSTLFSFVSKLTILYFATVWGSAALISVLESQSSFDSLRQSRANTSFLFYFSSFLAVFVTGLIMIASVMYICVVVRDVKLETKCHLCVQACADLLVLYLAFLQYVVMITVLYFEWSNAEAQRGEDSSKMDYDSC